MTMTDTTTAALIEATDVVKRYGRRTAVDGISVAAGRGVVGLLGPNGAGKTTLLKMVATVLAPAGELVRLDLSADLGRQRGAHVYLGEDAEAFRGERLGDPSLGLVEGAGNGGRHGDVGHGIS